MLGGTGLNLYMALYTTGLWEDRAGLTQPDYAVTGCSLWKWAFLIHQKLADVSDKYL